MVSRVGVSVTRVTLVGLWRWDRGTVSREALRGGALRASETDGLRGAAGRRRPPGLSCGGPDGRGRDAGRYECARHAVLLAGLCV